LSSVGGQLHGLAALRDPERVLVDLEDGVAETARRRRRPTPSQDRPHPRDQLFDAERLGEIVVTALGEPGDPVLRGVAGGEEHHRRLVTRRPQPPAHLEPVDARQADVEHHDVGVIALDGGVGVEAAARNGGGEARNAQRARGQVADELVVDDEDGGVGHGGSRAPLPGRTLTSRWEP
jgi:hypothetical protein